MIIEMQDICFAYDQQIALRNINMAIPKGSTIILEGSNGCGKSTLLKLINCIIFPNKGKYFFEGIEINSKIMKDDLALKALHQKIGFIFQDVFAQLFCSSVYDEVAFGPMQMGLPSNEVEKRVEDTMELIGIGHLRDRAPYHLSGGEKRKVAIASVLSMNPKVLCFDEPLTGLDRKSQDWFIDFMKILKQTDKTIIIATHDDRVIKELQTHIFSFNDNHELFLK